VISPTQGPQLDNTQHSQEKDIHVSGGIRTRNPSKRAFLDLRLRPRGQWDRHFKNYTYIYYLFIINDNTLTSVVPILGKKNLGWYRRVVYFLSAKC